MEINNKFKEAVANTQADAERSNNVFERLMDSEKTVSRMDELMKLREGQLGDLTEKIKLYEIEQNKKQLHLSLQCDKLQAQLEKQMVSLNIKVSGSIDD